MKMKRAEYEYSGFTVVYGLRNLGLLHLIVTGRRQAKGVLCHVLGAVAR